MIIECQACRARFKLDESRIKGKGARIRCRKCGEAIIIMKSDLPAAPPPPAVEKEVFDLRAQLQGPDARSRTEEPPIAEEADRESFPAEEAVQSAEPPSSPGETVGDTWNGLDARETASGVPDAAEEPERPAEPDPHPWVPEAASPADESPSFTGGASAAELESPSPAGEEPGAVALSEPDEGEQPEDAQPEPPGSEAVEPESAEGNPGEQAVEPAAAVSDNDDIELDDSLVRLFRGDETGLPASSAFGEEEGTADAQPEPPAQESPDRELADREQTESVEEPPVSVDDDAGSAFQRFLHEDREPETVGPTSAESSGPHPENDTSFDSPLFEGDAGEPVPAPRTEEPPESWPAEAPMAGQGEPEEDAALARPPEEPLVDAPAEVAAGESLSPGPPLEEEGLASESEEFLTLDADLPDFLRKEESGGEPDRRFDISSRLSDTPDDLPGVDPTPAELRPEIPIPAPEPPLSRAEEIQEELAGLSGAEPAEEEAPPVPPPPDVLQPTPVEEEKGRPSRRPSPAPSTRPSFALLALLFLTLAGGGAYLAFTDLGQSNLRAVVSRLESFWLGGKSAAATYTVKNLIGYYETSSKAGKLFVIKGAVTNGGQVKRSAIRIRAELLDADHRTIAEKTAYAGNVISGLRSADRGHIEAAMSNRFGNSLSNVDVAPGKSVAFMVVFFDPPDGIEEYRMEPMQGE